MTQVYSEFDIQESVKQIRTQYDSQCTRPLSYRMEQLRAFHRLLEEGQDEILDALFKDLGKPKAEGYLTEVAPVKNSISHAIQHLEEFLEPKSVDRPLPFLFDRLETRNVPLGVILIISPWNYPIQLALNPLVGAIAGGNTAIIKPSEIAPHTADVMAKLIPKYLDSKSFRVIQGAIPETTILLQQKFDLIFYTGSTQVGRIVMKAAAQQLTPVVLELGGKSPVIVDSTVDPVIAAKRIIWGKLVNCGQTCIAPDYIVVHKDIAKPFKQALKDSIKIVLDGPDAQKSPYYGRIVSNNHFNRLKTLIERQNQVAESQMEVGGSLDEKDLFIEPTIFSIDKTADTTPVMEGELFGPLLPVIEVDSVDEAIRYVKEKVPGDPLSLYVFTKKTEVWEKVFASINCGHAVVNETLMNAGVEDLPFGGVNESGMGSYHGKHSLQIFTREQGYFIRGIANDWVNYFKYPANMGKYGSTGFKRLMGGLETAPPSNLRLFLNRHYRCFGGNNGVAMLLAFGVGMAVATTLIRARL